MDISYAAGLIDGEGYIGIQETDGSMQLRLKVAMTDKGLPSLLAMHRAFGGHLAEDRPAGERTRASHVWRLNGRKAANLIEQLQPLLLTKAEPARIALQFQQMIDEAPKRTNRQAIWDDEMRRRARVFRARIQEANRTGPDPALPTLPPERPLAVRKYGEWWEPDEDLFGPVEFSGRLPTSGRMIAGRIYPQAAPASSTSSPGLLPTPTTQDGANTAGPSQFDRNSLPLNAVAVLLPTPKATDGTKGGPNQRGSSGDLTLPSAAVQLLPTPVVTDAKGAWNATSGRREGSQHHSGTTLTDAVSLLPTPTASVANDGESTETWLARRDRVKLTARNGNGMGMPLTIAVQLLAEGVS